MIVPKKLVSWISLILIAGCGGETGPRGDGPGAGGPDAAPEMPLPPDAAASTSLTGLLLAALPSLHPAAGVRMTIEGHPEIPAVTSDADGQFRFPAVPSNTDIVVLGEKDDHVPVASRILNTGTVEKVIDPMFMLELDSMPLLADMSDVELMPGTGLIMGFVMSSADDTQMAGMRGGLSPEAGVFRYASETGFVDPELTETSSQGIFVVWHLAPGDYTASAGSDTNDTCRAAGLDNVVTPTVRIYADTLSHVTFVCD